MRARKTQTQHIQQSLAPFPPASPARVAADRFDDPAGSHSFGDLGSDVAPAPCAVQPARAPGASAPESFDAVAQQRGERAPDEQDAPTKLQDKVRTQKVAMPGRGKGIGQKRPQNAGENAAATNANAQTAKKASEVAGETLEGREWDRMQRFPATKTAPTSSDGQNGPQNASEIARENADHAGEAQNDAQKSMLNNTYVDKNGAGQRIRHATRKRQGEKRPTVTPKLVPRYRRRCANHDANDVSDTVWP